MPSRPWMLGAAAALLLPLAATAQTPAPPAFAPGTTMAKLAQSGTVRAGVKFDQPLFGLRNLSGQPVGFDIDIAKLIAARLGIKPDKIQWVETSSSNREPFLQQNKVDFIVATYAINDKRRQVVDLAGPYIVGGQDLMVKKGNPLHLGGPADLGGKKACVIGGSEGQAILAAKYPTAQVVPFDVVSKCVEALRNGSIDALVTSNLIEAGLVSRAPETFELLNKPFTVEPWGVGLQKGDTAFCTFVSKALQDAQDSGEYTRMYDADLGRFMPGRNQLPKLDPC